MRITEIPAKPEEPKIIRVAAYARVSTEKDAAFHSLEAQRDYYEEYIAAHPDWELAGLYSDNGISGTLVDRPEFQRMLQDCRDGKVDLIVTKSVTRFARNTVVLLETIRELKTLGIDVFFEKEDMHSISPDGELLLTLLAMYAEEEARSASENQKWRIRRKFEAGEPWVGNMLGYRLIDGEMVVVPEEAEIVRQIFNDYLSGMGRYRIAKKLILQGVFPASGNTWSDTSIRSILRNEKYAGNMLLQKTYRPDFRTKVDKKNHGEVRQYYVENNHAAIIDPKTFAAVQKQMDKNERHFRQPAKYHLFRGFIRCGYCGHAFRYYRTNAKKYDKAIWACPKFYNMGKKICPSQRIPEDILMDKTREVLGVEVISRELLEQRISEIIIPGHNRLIYHLKDGSMKDVTWEHRSRRESWTPEMRQLAREKELNRIGKGNEK